MSIRATAIAVVLSSLAIFLLHESAALVAPIFVSLLIAYALDPVVALIMRARVSRITAALLTYLMLTILTGSLARRVVSQAETFAGDLPSTVAEASRMWRDSSSRHTPAAIGRVQRAADELGRVVGAQPTPTAPDVQRVEVVAPGFDLNAYLASLGVSAAMTGIEAAVIGLLSFLMICAGDVYRRKFIVIGGRAFESRRLTIEVIQAIDRQIQRYLLVRLLISGIVAAATGVGLWIVGVPHAFAWGIIAGVLNVLPFIGPTVAVGLIAAAAFVTLKAVEPTVAATLVAGTVAALEGNLITPALTSRAGEINTVAVFVSVLFWGWLWGLPGLLLAIPIMVAVKAAADHIEPLQPIGELLGL